MKKRIRSIVKIEPELGEVFEYLGVRAQCIEDDAYDSRECRRCAFYGCKQCDTICCAAHERGDDKDVHFIKLHKP